MKTVFFLATKDLNQRKKEVAMVIVAITIGIAGVTFNTALNNGILESFVGNVVNTNLGHIKILPETGKDRIDKTNSIIDKIDDLPGIVGVAPRIIEGVDIRSKSSHAGGSFLGIIPSKEEKTTTLVNFLAEGEFLSDEDDFNVLIGAGLAEDLKVEVGDDVIISKVGSEKILSYKVKGILKTGTRLFDKYTVFISYKAMQRIYGIKDASEILIRVNQREDAEKFRVLIKKETDNTNVQTWEELSQAQAGVVKQMKMVSVITAGISIMVAAIAVTLIIYISVKNKIRVIGILKAIGARDSLIFEIFVMEAFLIGLIGTFSGTLLGLGIVRWMSFHPIVSELEPGVFAIITPYVTYDSVLLIDTIVIVACVLGCVFPTLKASRIEIIKAIWQG